MKTRRQFLSTCTVFSLGASLAPSAVLSAPAPVAAETVALDQIRYDSFASRLGEKFKIYGANGKAVTLTLVQTTWGNEGAACGRFAGMETFSLLFLGPALLGQNTHTFEHADLGRFAMFIVPVEKRTGDDAWYEAVFNRPIPGART